MANKKGVSIPFKRESLSKGRTTGSRSAESICFHSLQTGTRRQSSSPHAPQSTHYSFHSLQTRKGRQREFTTDEYNRLKSKVSIPFKRERGDKEKPRLERYQPNRVSIPFKRERGDKGSGYALTSAPLTKKFPFPSNGKGDSKATGIPTNLLPVGE